MDHKTVEITPEIMSEHLRRAHVERSIAITRAFREATRSVKNIFTAPDAGDMACDH